MHSRRAFCFIGVSLVHARAFTPSLSPSDRRPFRSWFTWLAEALYHMPEARRPREVADCSALLRFSYREARRPHTAQWASEIGLDWMPPLPELKHPTRESAVFQVASGAMRQFADAEHLMRYNTRLITRDIHLAQPGDLLFYRQLVPSQPWHSMVFLGPSSFDTLREPCIVYHTGPSRNDRGEIRRPTLSQLLGHPEPRWRPVAGNSNFLGVFRWNVLCESD